MTVGGAAARQIRLGTGLFGVATAFWSHPGKGHDRIQVQDNFIGLADGATPLEQGSPDPGVFAQSALDALWQRSQGFSGSASELLRIAIGEVSRETRGGVPVSCSVAMARTWGTRIEFSLLGDCSILISLRDGSLRRMLDVRLRDLDKRALADADPVAARRRNRALMNTDEGYWIFGSDTRAGEHAARAQFGSDEVAWFIMSTDGLGANLDPVTGDDMAMALVTRSGDTSAT